MDVGDTVDGRVISTRLDTRRTRNEKDERYKKNGKRDVRNERVYQARFVVEKARAGE